MNGSSSKSTFGPWICARASVRRWAIPREKPRHRPLGETFESDCREGDRDPGLITHSVEPREEAEILSGGQGVIEKGLVRDETEFAPRLAIAKRRALPADADRSTSGMVDPREDPEQGGLPRAVGSQEDEPLARAEVE